MDIKYLHDGENTVIIKFLGSNKTTNMFKKIALKAGMILVGMILWFVIISFCNWDLNPAHWSGFSRFLLAIFCIIVIYTASTD